MNRAPIRPIPLPDLLQDVQFVRDEIIREMITEGWSLERANRLAVVQISHQAIAAAAQKP